MCEKKNISIVNMGGNPLPIYVLLKHFSEPITKKENQTNVGNEKVLNKLYHPHKIIIIYSNKTNYYFDRLVKILRRDKKADITKSKIIGINLKNAQRDFLKITK